MLVFKVEKLLYMLSKTFGLPNLKTWWGAWWVVDGETDGELQKKNILSSFSWSKFASYNFVAHHNLICRTWFIFWNCWNFVKYPKHPNFVNSADRRIWQSHH